MSKEVPESHLQLGILGKTFQLAGGLRFYPLGNAEAEAIFKLNSLFIEGIGDIDIRQVKANGKDTIIYLTNALSIEKARLLVNKRVFADAQSLPVIEDAFYLDELIGLDVFLDGELIGEVESVIEAGLQDILTVSTQTGSFMIPLQAPYLEFEDDGIHLSDVPEGLLELNG